MKRGLAKRLLTACFTLGAATALAARAQAQDTSQTGAAPMDTAPTTPVAGDTLGGDSTKWGYPVDTSKAQNPPGYRGMETPAGVDSAERAAGDSGIVADSTGSDSARAASDTSATGGNAADGSAPDTTAAGQEQPYQPTGPEKRMHPDSAARSDTSSP